MERVILHLWRTLCGRNSIEFIDTARNEMGTAPTENLNETFHINNNIIIYLPATRKTLCGVVTEYNYEFIISKYCTECRHKSSM